MLPAIVIIVSIVLSVSVPVRPSCARHCDAHQQ
jgi:hypothetical protein